MAMDSSDGLQLRFAAREQIAAMKRLGMPAVILPLGSQKDDASPWVFESIAGPISAPGPEAFAKVLEQIVDYGLMWRFVPGGLSLYISPPFVGEPFRSLANGW